jgi:hypothetical protein
VIGVAQKRSAAHVEQPQPHNNAISSIPRTRKKRKLNKVQISRAEHKIESPIANLAGNRVVGNGETSRLHERYHKRQFHTASTSDASTGDITEQLGIAAKRAPGKQSHGVPST